MAEQVRVVVSVDKSKLNELKTDIGKIDGKHIKIQTTFDKDGKVKRNVETINVGLGKTEQIVTSIGKKGETVTRTLTQDMKKASLAGDLLGDSLTRIIGKMAAWQILGNLISAVIGSLKTAVSTLKEVDSALVTIRKTTDYTEAQIEKLTETTYELASAYGRTADELLNLSATFARAGMGDQLEQMTELAALLENVGDIEGDTAAKFILAANAAWKLGGDYDSLMQIIDGMNAVTNKAAVDMEALTTGITVSGSVFANAGESAQTYTALVGTAVAATQRSGAEIARGLRTIAMNVRAIKGELEDGEIIDDSTISDAAKALASVGINTADARGELRLTSDVLADLAGKWDRLTTAEQSYLAQSLAGKRQANILTALMQNWGEVERQMTLYADGAGSALRENELYLDSWEAKSKQLSASWTQFVSHMVDTRAVKTSLDVLNVAVEALDSDVGQAAVTVGALTAAISGLSAATAGLKQTAGGKAFLDTLVSGSTLKIAAAVAAGYALLKLYDGIFNAYANHVKALEDLKSEYENTYGTGSEIDRLEQKENNLTEAEKERLVYLQLQRKELLEQIAAEQEITFEEWRRRQNAPKNPAFFGIEDDIGIAEGTNRTEDALQRSKDALESLNQQYKKNELTVSEYKKGLQDIVSALKEDAEIIREEKYAKDDLTEAEQGLLDLYDLMIGRLKDLIEDGKDYAKTTNAITVALKSQEEIYSDVSERANAIISAMKEIAESGGMTDKTMEALVKLFPDLRDELTLTADGWKISTEALEAHYKALDADYQLAYEQASNAAISILTAQGVEADAYDKTTESIIRQLKAKRDLLAANGRTLGMQATAQQDAFLAEHGNDAIGRAMMRAAGVGATEWNQIHTYIYPAIDELDAAIAALENADRNRQSVQEVLATMRERSSSGSGIDNATDKRLEALKNIVALRKQEQAFLSESGADVRDQVAKMREIQSALTAQADYMRSIGADEKDILAVTTEWWSWQNKITKALEDADDTLDRLKDALKGAKEEALALLDAQEQDAVGPLQEQLDILKAQKEAVEDTREEEERRLAVEQARIALENAQNERTVRQYNAATGQWEWTANAQAVEKAQENLLTASKALADYYTDREIAALEAQIDTVQSAYSELRSAVNDFSSAIDKGTLSFLEAMSYFTAAAEKVGLGSLAGQLAGSYQSAGADTILARMKANGAAWGSASPEVKKDLEEENWRLGTSQGWTRIEGAWYDKAGNRLYDGGGILRGYGGVKATGGDEMILPPGVTASLLNAERSGAFDALLAHLGIVTTAAQSFAGFGAVSSSRIGSQHNGDVYEIGGITLSEAQARGMTVFDLAQMARTLSLHNV